MCIRDRAVTGERQIDGHWYYFDANGIMQTGFVNLGYKIVYYNYNGWMLYGEHQLNGYWYYFDTGKMCIRDSLRTVQKKL